MKALAVVLSLLVCPGFTHAADHWKFGKKIAVSNTTDSVFHHLDGAGRKHIAVSAQSVAVIWEDNSSSDPQVYLAIKSAASDSFSQARQLSNGQEAYEPAIAALKGGRFAAAWEQESSVYVRLIDPSGKPAGNALKLSTSVAGHASLASMHDRLFVVWREQLQGRWSLKLAQLQLGDDVLQIKSRHQVEQQALQTPVLMPTISVSVAGICVAWEDRREGHTRLLFSYSNDRGESFSSPQYLNEFQSGRNEYDKGSGVTRVSIEAFGEDEVIAAWMDKRRSNTGYGIFAAIGSDGGDSFGPNEKVHGQPGDRQPHNNPATAGNAEGDFVLAWDDFRTGSSDIWLASYDENGEWSSNHSPAVASGAGEQTHASITMDDDAGVHLVWIERADSLAPTSLWYSYSPSTQ